MESQKVFCFCHPKGKKIKNKWALVGLNGEQD
jgi:hypothetical protein